MPDTFELTQDTTHDEIQAYVDQLVNVEAEGDAAKIAAERDQPDIPTTEPETGSDDTAEKGEEPETSWIDDEVKAEAAAYGIEEAELADFTSREELDRALRLFDRKVLEAGHKAGQATEKPVRDEQGRFVKSEETKEEISITPTEGRYEITLSKDIYDEGLVDEFARLRDHYETRLGVLESRFAEADAMVKQQQFDSAVDALGHHDLFGKTGQEDAKELKRRQDLFLECEAMLVGLRNQNRQVGSYEALVRRVARMVFADELGKKELKARTRQIAKQSNGRQGGGATKPHEAGESLRDEMRRLYKDLENA